MARRAQSQDLLTAATTRSVLRTPEVKPQFLKPGQTIASPETRLRFQVGHLLGRGGFGEVYLTRRLGQSSTVPDVVCVKASSRIDGWLREAYFGQLLDGHPRAIRIFDAFPLVLDNGQQFLYCLVLEFAKHGDQSAFLQRDGARWTEASVRREIAGVLDVLGKLHRGQLLHRDLTPVNVFVCDKRQLKLGDFGIVRQQTNQRGITARTMNAFTAPSEFLAGTAPKWQARDDVYQVGQLLGMLLKGDARVRTRTTDVRGLPCGDREGCAPVSPERQSGASANELIEALANPPGGSGRHLRSPRVHRLHRNSRAASRGSDSRSTTGWRDRPRRPVDAYDRRRARPAERASGRWQTGRAEVDGNQTASRARPSDHVAERIEILGTCQNASEKLRDQQTA
jgi:serine/threonine protein kinase